MIQEDQALVATIISVRCLVAHLGKDCDTLLKARLFICCRLCQFGKFLLSLANRLNEHVQLLINVGPVRIDLLIQLQLTPLFLRLIALLYNILDLWKGLASNLCVGIFISGIFSQLDLINILRWHELCCAVEGYLLALER